MRALSNHNTLQRVVGLSAAGLSFAGLVACGGPAKTAHPAESALAQSSVAPQAIPSRASRLILNLDFSNLEPDGQTCMDGNLRPCFQPVRTRPEFTGVDDYLNKLGSLGGKACAVWPYEGHGPSRELCTDEDGPVIAGEDHGNNLSVVCQVEGATVTAPRTGQTSRVWDVVEVPPEYLSPTAMQRAQADQPGFGVAKDTSGAIVAVYGMVPDMWLGNHGIYAELNACTQQQNPQHFTPAK